jgi:hypothetical protein
MFGSMVLEVATGVIFVYLLLSLMVTAITELISGWLKWRATDLRKGIHKLIDSEGSAKWVDALYDHPLIQGLSPGKGDAKGKGPSYIPSRTFALALLDVVRDTNSAGESRSLESLLQDLPDAKLRKSLLCLLEESQGNIESFKENVEIWFNNSMARVSGWYKRRTQLVHILLAVALTLVINVDTVLVVNALSRNPALRESVTAQAEAYAQQQQRTEETEPTPAPTAETADTEGAGQDGTTVAAAKSADPDETFRKLRAQLDALELPVGWVLPKENQEPEEGQPNADFREWPGWWPSGAASPWATLWAQTIRFHLFGWVLTAFAISLGAPFWFDMLNKVINIRSSGKAPEEKPKPPREVPQPLEPGQTPAQADALASSQKR